VIPRSVVGRLEHGGLEELHRSVVLRKNIADMCHDAEVSVATGARIRADAFVWECSRGHRS